MCRRWRYAPLSALVEEGDPLPVCICPPDFKVWSLTFIAHAAVRLFFCTLPFIAAMVVLFSIYCLNRGRYFSGIVNWWFGGGMFSGVFLQGRVEVFLKVMDEVFRIDWDGGQYIQVDSVYELRVIFCKNSGRVWGIPGMLLKTSVLFFVGQ